MPELIEVDWLRLQLPVYCQCLCEFTLIYFILFSIYISLLF